MSGEKITDSGANVDEEALSAISDKWLELAPENPAREDEIPTEVGGGLGDLMKSREAPESRRDRVNFGKKFLNPIKNLMTSDKPDDNAVNALLRHAGKKYKEPKKNGRVKKEESLYKADRRTPVGELEL